MICRVVTKSDGSGTETTTLDKIQLSKYPQCALFSQELVDNGTAVHVKYMAPAEPLVPADPKQSETLVVPLEPDVADLNREDVNVHNSAVSAYRMGGHYDEWFSACFGFQVALLYIGDERRPVLGTFSPKSKAQQSGPAKGWLSTISSYVAGGGGAAEEPDWLNFSDCAPYLVATEASLANVSARLSQGDMDMIKFRPNIVVDGQTQWDEDFWAELSLLPEGTSGESSRSPAITLTKMCNRCTSVNVDYDTGRVAEGERGAVLKKLMSDRRVDKGVKYSPIFGRYGFLAPGADGLAIRVGDEIWVTGRTEERSVWDWPMGDSGVATYYQKVLS
jgi:uncharacterized protein YcbX